MFGRNNNKDSRNLHHHPQGPIEKKEKPFKGKDSKKLKEDTKFGEKDYSKHSNQYDNSNDRFFDKRTPRTHKRRQAVAEERALDLDARLDVDPALDPFGDDSDNDILPPPSFDQ